jgi:hypothetical protein
MGRKKHVDCECPLIWVGLLMPVFSFVGCMLNRHAPIRRDVAWHGRTYRGHCRHCGAEIERHGRNDWRKCKPMTKDNGSAQA